MRAAPVAALVAAVLAAGCSDGGGGEPAALEPGVQAGAESLPLNSTLAANLTTPILGVSADMRILLEGPGLRHVRIAAVEAFQVTAARLAWGDGDADPAAQSALALLPADWKAPTRCGPLPQDAWAWSSATSPGAAPAWTVPAGDYLLVAWQDRAPGLEVDLGAPGDAPATPADTLPVPGNATIHRPFLRTASGPPATVDFEEPVAPAGPGILLAMLNPAAQATLPPSSVRLAVQDGGGTCVNVVRAAAPVFESAGITAGVQAVLPAGPHTWLGHSEATAQGTGVSDAVGVFLPVGPQAGSLGPPRK